MGAKHPVRRTTIIPAQPGFKALAVSNDLAHQITEHPIIAWKITEELDEGIEGDTYITRMPYPITASHGHDLFENFQAIEQPYGPIMWERKEYKTREAWLVDVVKRINLPPDPALSG